MSDYFEQIFEIIRNQNTPSYDIIELMKKLDSLGYPLERIKPKRYLGDSIILRVTDRISD